MVGTSNDGENDSRTINKGRHRTLKVDKSPVDDLFKNKVLTFDDIDKLNYK